ncbi:MAG: hypothetical protein KF901_33405 [Myxococcales bacterium]|nr:hypothetical protein [Myxococcales bacterium]
MRLLRSLCLVIAACAPPVDSASERLEVDDLGPLGGEWSLVFDQRVFVAPLGGDGPSRYTLAWERGTERVVSALPPVLEAFTFDFGEPARDGRPDVVALLPDGRLTRFRGGDPQRAVVLAEDIVGRPGVASHAFVYVKSVEGGAGTVAEVHWVEGGDDRVLDRSLSTFGGLRVAPDGLHVLGFGAVNGGIAGVHVIGPEGARCLSNCALRTGPGWLAQAGDEFIPLPRAADGLRFDGDDVLWEAGGATFRATWRVR